MDSSNLNTEAIKSPGLDRSVIEELSNLDPVAMRNLKEMGCNDRFSYS